MPRGEAASQPQHALLDPPPAGHFPPPTTPAPPPLSPSSPDELDGEHHAHKSRGEQAHPQGARPHQVELVQGVPHVYLACDMNQSLPGFRTCFFMLVQQERHNYEGGEGAGLESASDVNGTAGATGQGPNERGDAGWVLSRLKQVQQGGTA